MVLHYIYTGRIKIEKGDHQFSRIPFCSNLGDAMWRDKIHNEREKEVVEDISRCSVMCGKISFTKSEIETSKELYEKKYNSTEIYNGPDPSDIVKQKINCIFFNDHKKFGDLIKLSEMAKVEGFTTKLFDEFRRSMRRGKVRFKNEGCENWMGYYKIAQKYNKKCENVKQKLEQCFTDNMTNFLNTGTFLKYSENERTLSSFLRILEKWDQEWRN